MRIDYYYDNFWMEVNIVTTSIQSLVHDMSATTSNNETFCHYFQETQKLMLPNF